ncbi:CBS domain-containing protein [Haliovirga abyssi]|uniref:Poly(A) polymerase n=1 Tax=Haliovirga abyssi TaxID=2996794 RepID=A0AAU9DKM7_9FUSO|nr:CBS domain-containing protein [Haliovirga abyssi]BDU50457.1 poly(A) polymerase [Haliovirga abyssi]
MIKIDIIISHSHLDLDGLASMIVAKKLYPNASLVFAGNVNENVHTLVGLYQDYLNIYKAKEINIDKVKKMIIVDTSGKNRIGKFKKILNKENVEIIIYDHHNQDEHSIITQNKFLSETGANTTFLLRIALEKIKELNFTEYEATILMMGIYEDTGSLSYSSTTPEDIKMAAYLLENNANLEIVNQYISKALKKDQVELFLKLIEAGEIIEFSVDSIFVGKYNNDSFVDGLDVVANKIKDIEGTNGVFILIGNDKNSYIIGRSSSLNIRVDDILSEFNGGGHSNAGSAVIKQENFEEIYKKLKKVILKNVKIEKLARDIMQYPVKTVFSDVKIKEVYKIMLRFGYSGIPIMENENLVGMISRKDIDKAISHGFSNAPVKAYMSGELITITQNTPLEKMKKLMIENEIGRLPILDENSNLIGIVTRSDILRNLYEIRKKTDKKNKKFEDNIKTVLKNRMKEDVLQLLLKIREVSEVRKEKVYIVGGIVRDLLLGIENFDLDIVVEGNGMNFAKELGEKLNAKKVVLHSKFRTGVVIVDEKLKIDVASSRVEYYEYPTSLPVVEYGNIKQDLYRRDFTINAMAIEIDYNKFGRLIDYFKGYSDLKNGKIRILHNFSFVEDPTRIIRGIRFAVRYNFEFDAETKRFAKLSVEEGFLKRLTWKRVKYEIELILNEKNPKKAIYMLEEYGVLKAIHKSIKLTKKTEVAFKNLEKYKEYITKLNLKQWIVYFLVLLEDLNSEELTNIFFKFHFPNKFIEKYKFGKIKREKIIDELKSSEKKSKIYNSLKKLSGDLILLLLITVDSEKEENKILEYINEIRNIKPLIMGKDLIKLGYKPNENFKNILNISFMYQLDNQELCKEELLQYIKNLNIFL